MFGHTHSVVDGELGGRLAVEGISLDVLRDPRLYSVDRRLVRIDADPSYESKVRLVTDVDP